MFTAVRKPSCRRTRLPSYTPPWVQRVTMWAELSKRDVTYALCNDSPTLLWFGSTAVLQDQHDEWQDGRRHFSQQSMARLMHPDGPPLLTNPLTEGLVA